MSTLWTPHGDHEPRAGADSDARPGPGAPEGSAPGGASPSPEEMAQAREALRKAREELLGTPVADIVANHAIGLWQLAILHLGLDAGEEEDPAAGREPNLPEAKLAVDSMAALVEGVGDRLGEHGEALRGALAQLQLAYVQVSDGPGEAPDA